MSKPLISVIIPVYNQAEELCNSLASLLCQSYEHYEVIIVNDGSTDGTARIIEEMQRRFVSKDIHVQVISQNNQGSNPARSRGFQESKGEFIIFWDADIVASPHMLKQLYEALLQDPDASYAYCSFTFGKKKFTLWPFDADKLRQMPYIHSSSLIRREHFPTGGWDPEIKRLQDWDLWLTMLAENHVGTWVAEDLFTAQTAHGTMSSWLPKFAYKLLPWHKQVKKYKAAEEIIKQKHGV